MKTILLLEDDVTLGCGIQLALQGPEVTIRLCATLAQAREVLAQLKATPHNGSCGLRQVFCPIRAVYENGKYTKYSRVFKTFGWSKIPRRISLPHYVVLP